jgi:hypothetical protein
MGILDVFFRNYLYHVSLLVSEFIYLNFAHFSKSFNSNDPG